MNVSVDINIDSIVVIIVSCIIGCDRVDRVSIGRSTTAAVTLEAVQTVVVHCIHDAAVIAAITGVSCVDGILFGQLVRGSVGGVVGVVVGKKGKTKFVLGRR